MSGPDTNSGSTPRPDGDAFRTHGISSQQAKNYLDTAEGRQYLRSLIEADPTASLRDIDNRAIEQLTSARELPRTETISEPLVKIVPNGQAPSAYTPYFARKGAFEEALRDGHRLSDRFALPEASSSDTYSIFEIRPKEPTQVYSHTVAPATEAGGIKPGGAEQILVTNRKAFSDPIHLGNIGNDLDLHQGLVNRGAASSLTSPGTITRAPGSGAASASETAATSELAIKAGELKSGTAATKGLAVVGAAALAYDFIDTGHQVVKLEAQGNTTGADSAKAHFVGRNVGGIGGGIAGGFLAGAGYGLIAGSETGPGALVTGGIGGVIGGVGGAFMGEKWAQQKDIDRVFTQKDADGNEWHRDPSDAKGSWTRVAETQQVRADAHATDPNYNNVRYVAAGTLANQLNYKSANASYELGLANVARPQDPYSIPATSNEARSLDGEGNWMRDPQTHQWSRTVVDQYIEHGMKVTHGEIATPQRAETLEQASRLIVAQNAANSPAAIAARYEVAYHQFGWNQFGEMPAAVLNAKNSSESLQASDGHTYTRDAGGAWTTPGTVYGTNDAPPRIRDELNATYQSQRAGLEQMAGIAAEAKAHPTVPGPVTLRDLVANAYTSAGVERTEAQIDAATAAVTHTRTREGLDQAGRPYTLTLQPEPGTGRPGPNSAIVTMMDDGKDGMFSESRMVPRATTTADEIRQAGLVSAPASPVAPNRGQNHQVTPQFDAQPRDDKRDTSITPVDPTAPSHPDHALLEQIRTGVRKLDENAGRPYDERSERLSRSLLAACKGDADAYPGQSLSANALHRADHVLVGPTGNAFVVEGRLDDPAQKRAMVSVEQAMQTPVEQSDAKLQAANQSISQEQLLAQQQHVSRQQSQGNHSLGM